MRESPRRREKRRQRFGGVDGGPAGLDAGLDKEKTGLSASARGCLVPARFNGRVSVLKAAEERKPPARSPRTEGLRHVFEKSSDTATVPAPPCSALPFSPVSRRRRFCGISAPLGRQLRGRVRRAGFAALPDIFHHLCSITAAPMLCASRLCRQGTSRQTSADVPPMRSPARPNE